MPANLITLAHFSVSSAISFLKSAGFASRVSAPELGRRKVKPRHCCGVDSPVAFRFDLDKADPSKVAPTAAAFADDQCEHCHREHASTDNVWVQFYPTLRK